MGAAAAIPAAIGGAGSLMSANAGKNAQKAANAAAGDAARNQGQVVGAETGALDQMLQQYFAPQTGTPGSNNAGTQVNSANLQNSLMNQYGANPLNQGQQSTMGTASQLQNFNGLQPGQLSALQNQLGASNQSAVNSLRASGGGVANQNNMYSDLMRGGQQSATNAGVQLGGQAAANQLAGLQSAGQLQSGVGGQQNQSQGQALSGLEGLFGQGGSGLQSVLQSLGNLSSMYGQQGAAAAGQAKSIGSPYGNALTQIGGGGMPSMGGKNGQTATSNSISSGGSNPIVNPGATATYTMDNMRNTSGGAPSAQGFNGGLGGAQNPNTGGFNGLAGSEMTNPGMGYQSAMGSLGPARR